jgi:hypothetical protein
VLQSRLRRGSVAGSNINPSGSRNLRKELSGRLSVHGDETSLRTGAGTVTQVEFNRFQRPMVYLSTALGLGIANIVRVLTHRTCKRVGIYQWLLPPAKAAPLELQIDLSRDVARPPVPWGDRSVLREADELLAGRMNYFSVHAQNVGNPPDWFSNPFENTRHPQCAIHWSSIPHFNTDVGDIKIIWELSRFTWAPVFARAWRTSGDARYLSALYLWIQDWWWRNPPNTGPNWMCGQEASIRLINMLLALRIAELKNIGPGLARFVEAHCKRIECTTFYAVAQDNNHGTSEA